MGHACDRSLEEAEAGGSLVAGQPGLHTVILSQKQKTNQIARLVTQLHGIPVSYTLLP